MLRIAFVSAAKDCKEIMDTMDTNHPALRAPLLKQEGSFMDTMDKMDTMDFMDMMDSFRVLDYWNFWSATMLVFFINFARIKNHLLR